MKQLLIFGLLSCLTTSCFQSRPRDCKAYTNGTFEFTEEIDGKQLRTVFTRKDNMEISTFNQHIDTASVRWINDCEYILNNRKPKNKAEQQAIHIKIISTSDKGYSFEYGLVGSSKKNKGNAIKIQ
ncbi:MAG: DNA topoisomerase IV [Flavobacteriaceae bacterium]|nr:DNA topoisomerase IV [Flavobacteriaceae bacterium]